MQIEPQASAFAKRYAGGEAQVVWTTLVADLETPVSAFLKIAGSRPLSFLLESVEGGAVRGRYSIIGLEPDLIWRTVAGKAEIDRTGRGKKRRFVPCNEPPLEALRALVAESAIELPDALPPMAAGIFGYLGYDMVRLMEKLPSPNPDPIGLPDAVLVRPTIVVVFDAVKDTITVVTPVRPEKGVSAKSAHGAGERAPVGRRRCARPAARSFRRQVECRLADGAAGVQHHARRIRAHGAGGEGIHRRRRHLPGGAVAALRGAVRIAAVLALPRAAAGQPLALSLFPRPRRIRDRRIEPGNPGEGGGGTVTVRPIAGTRPRGATPHEDKALEAELLADPKERAEHLMLLDLGRNDVGRVAEIGTVKVTDQFFVERYSQVMHIVSNVEGTLSSKHDSIDALAAGFPAGTVSGAPKVRAMEIIDELEKEKRGLYAGAVGYFSAAGEMDTCIVLRTALVKDGMMYVQAGAGIVADSNPKSEQQECVNKAKALFRAAEEAKRFASAAGRGQ